MANAPIVVAEGDDDIELEYDSDGYPIIPERAKVSLETTPTLVVLILLSCQVVDPLPPVDHSEVTTLTLHTISHPHTTHYITPSHYHPHTITLSHPPTHRLTTQGSLETSTQSMRSFLL